MWCVGLRRVFLAFAWKVSKRGYSSVWDNGFLSCLLCLSLSWEDDTSGSISDTKGGASTLVSACWDPLPSSCYLSITASSQINYAIIIRTQNIDFYAISGSFDRAMGRLLSPKQHLMTKCRLRTFENRAQRWMNIRMYERGGYKIIEKLHNK
jgi:hypothetical protein